MRLNFLRFLGFSCQMIVLAQLLFFSAAFAMSGIAVTAVTNPKTTGWPSFLMVYTISNNRTVGQDTILKDGTFHRPTLSMDGKRIAFFRTGGGLSIIDIDGKNLRTCEKSCNTNERSPL